MWKKNFELGNHQRLLYNFMNKNTPYKSLLIFHGVGVGKTCSAVKISESFRDIYANDNNKIIVLRKGGLVKDGKKQYLILKWEKINVQDMNF